MKIMGAEWKAFEKDGWPPGYIWADDSILDDETDLYLEDGTIRFADAETFVVPDYWTITYEGPDGERIDNGDGLLLRSVIRKWRKARHFAMVVVTIPRAEVETAKALFAERGWRI